MYRTLLCLGTSPRFGIPTLDQITLFHEVGFEAFFTNWSADEDTKAIKAHADSLGMIYQSIHAPFLNAARMWQDDEAVAAEAVNELVACVNDCAENGVPIMVCHAFIGFKDHTPTPVGVENYRKVVLAAQEKGVKIAFENTEGEEYLAALMDAFRCYEHVGFCWDTGHELCYNRSRDMLALYGDRLFCTHLDDNLGIKDYYGEITYKDDLHLLPFDGVADWQDIVKRLNRHHYHGILTFELNKNNKYRHENDVYDEMTVERYVSEAYKRACRVAMLKMRDDRA